MLNIVILAIGKIKTKYFQDAINEYQTRLRPYAKIQMKELPAKAFDTNNKEQIKREETEKIIKALEKYPEAKIFILDENGKEFTSPELSKKIASENKQIVMVIAGSLGFDQSLLNPAWKKLSLSRLTFPHEMARMILLEQIYRAIAIEKNKEYHY